MATGDAKYARELAEQELGITDADIATMSFEEATASPRVRQTAGLIRFWWDAEQVQIGVSRMHQHKDGRVTGEVRVTTTAPGYPTNLHQSQLNFVAARSKADLAKALTERRNDLDWARIIEEMSWQVLDRIREGEPVIEITTADTVEPVSFLLYPVLPDDEPTVIYGLGASGKSLFALCCAMIIQLGKTADKDASHDNQLNLVLRERKNVLYLDWETNFKAITRRMKALQKGMGMPYTAIHYRSCAVPLADDCEAIRRAIMDNDIGFVVVDSIAAACGGDLNAAEPALRMFAALRQLKVTSLLVAHTSKNPATKETTIYGSGYFNFYSRSVWEMKKRQEPGARGLHVGLYHKKVNDSELFEPLGFKLSWSADRTATRIEPFKLAEIKELADHLPLKRRMVDLLIEMGAQTEEYVAEALDTTVATARTKLYELQRERKVVKMGKTWGALVKG